MKTHDLIIYRIDEINKFLSTNYQTDNCPQYGGYNLYKIGDDGASYRGPIGFDLRKSPKQMLEYVDGIYKLITSGWVYANDIITKN